MTEAFHDDNVDCDVVADLETKTIALRFTVSSENGTALCSFEMEPKKARELATKINALAETLEPSK